MAASKPTVVDRTRPPAPGWTPRKPPEPAVVQRSQLVWRHIGEAVYVPECPVCAATGIEPRDERMHGLGVWHEGGHQGERP